MTANELRAFEREVADAFEAGAIRGPVHLSDGNEDDLIAIFKDIPRSAWVFSTWRSHYHALLHGVPRERVMAEILAGRSMNLHFPSHRFFTSAIVGGILPIACGVASVGHEVFCFVGDMTATTGAFHDAVQFAEGYGLQMYFYVEDNGLSTNSPTAETWGKFYERPEDAATVIRYLYKRGIYPHVGTGTHVTF